MRAVARLPEVVVVGGVYIVSQCVRPLVVDAHIKRNVSATRTRGRPIVESLLPPLHLVRFQ